MKIKKYTALLLLLLSASVNAKDFSINFVNKRLAVSETAEAYELLQPIYQLHKKVYGQNLSSEFLLRVFTNFAKYKEYQSKHSTAVSDNGYYSGSSAEMVVYKNARYLKTIAHEFQHAVFRSYIKAPPKWLNEGLSEVFETVGKENDNTYVALQKQKYKRLPRIFKDDIYPMLLNYFGMSGKEWRKKNRKGNIFSISLAWAIVYYYLSNEDRKKELIGGLEKLKDGESFFNLKSKKDRNAIEELSKSLVQYYTNHPDKKLKI